MEAVLDVYERPYDPDEPLLCFDERPVQLISEVRTPILPEPGAHPERYDYEYKREGTGCWILTTSACESQQTIALRAWLR
jgi:hypothetical protein